MQAACFFTIFVFAPDADGMAAAGNAPIQTACRAATGLGRSVRLHGAALSGHPLARVLERSALERLLHYPVAAGPSALLLLLPAWPRHRPAGHRAGLNPVGSRRVTDLTLCRCACLVEAIGLAEQGCRASLVGAGAIQPRLAVTWIRQGQRGNGLEWICLAA